MNWIWWQQLTYLTKMISLSLGRLFILPQILSKKWPSDKLIILWNLTVPSNSNHNSSDLYLEECDYPLSSLVWICNSLIWYEPIWVVNCINLHIFDYNMYCLRLASPFHLRCIVNLGHTLILFLLAAAVFLGRATFLYPMCFVYHILLQY